jgi:hypothetical protein
MEWIKAMTSELKSLHDNQTWVLTKREHIPKGSKPLNVRWIYTVKSDISGKTKYKARVVAKGFAQKYGIDYQETFAPVANYRTLRVVLALAAYLDLEIDHLDVKTAFLNALIDKEVYVKIPDGYHLTSSKNLPTSATYVLLLLKSLYGLKQAPMLWNKDVDAFIQKELFAGQTTMVQSFADHCCYICSIAILVLYVDDILVITRDKGVSRQIREAMERKYKISDLGEVKTFLGLEITRDRKAKTHKVIITARSLHDSEWKISERPRHQ